MIEEEDRKLIAKLSEEREKERRRIDKELQLICFILTLTFISFMIIAKFILSK
jgi:hypothetical protein